MGVCGTIGVGVGLQAVSPKRARTALAYPTRELDGAMLLIVLDVDAEILGDRSIVGYLEPSTYSGLECLDDVQRQDCTGQCRPRTRQG